MNSREHVLPELELSTPVVREALQAVLHTILFLRAPGPVRPVDVDCVHFPNLAYSRIYCRDAGDAGGGTDHAAGIFSPEMPPPPTAYGGEWGGGSPLTGPGRDGGGLHRILGFEGNAADAFSQGRRHRRRRRHDVDAAVEESIESFMRSLTPVGPELLSGSVTLSFFERRTTRQLFGLVSSQERVVWEQWTVRVVVNNTPRPVNDDKASVIERRRIQVSGGGY